MEKGEIDKSIETLNYLHDWLQKELSYQVDMDLVTRDEANAQWKSINDVKKVLKIAVLRGLTLKEVRIMIQEIKPKNEQQTLKLNSNDNHPTP